METAEQIQQINTRIERIETDMHEVKADMHELKAGQKFIYWAFGVIVVLNLTVFSAIMHIGLSALK